MLVGLNPDSVQLHAGANKESIDSGQLNILMFSFGLERDLSLIRMKVY
jgi:hypothetical protein